LGGFDIPRIEIPGLWLNAVQLESPFDTDWGESPSLFSTVAMHSCAHPHASLAPNFERLLLFAPPFPSIDFPSIVQPLHCRVSLLGSQPQLPRCDIYTIPWRSPQTESGTKLCNNNFHKLEIIKSKYYAFITLQY